ncbi:MAG: ABC transporter ATP-binding protein [Rhodospirillaceae bacterium]|nr:ABC transporter ATP-binding protein [Rhodospirillaceae bacterium]
MLELDGVSKRFETGLLAVDRVSFTVDRGEILCLVGTSGCGKSTLLRMVSGLERPTSGEVRLDGTPVEGPRREVGMVFQEPRLMPWLRVAENVQFGLDGMDRARREALSAEVLNKVGLTRFARALPRELSGGMAQRVAIARALVGRPSVLLLDEPFSALDALTRMKLQDHLLEVWRYDRPTMVFVTHDIDEALVLADRILVMRGQPGRIHAEHPVALPRPRRRLDMAFQALKERVLDDLNLVGAFGGPPEPASEPEPAHPWQRLRRAIRQIDAR